MSERIILGIHSYYIHEDFDGGHAWLTIYDGKKTTYYGLWPDWHARARDNGDASDIRMNLENKDGKAKASRYYSLSPSQADRFRALTKANVHWSYTHNCASWASEVVLKITSEDVDADDWLGFETPRELGRNILQLERRAPTSLMAPKRLSKEPATSIITSGRGTADSLNKTSIGKSR